MGTRKKVKEMDMSKLDIIAAIPSFNEEDNIAFVAEQLGKGIKKHYPDKEAILINLDNGSTDNTEEAFLKSDTDVEKLVLRTEEGDIGKGFAVKLLLELVKKLGPRAVLVDDADLKSITPDWVKYQLDPIFEGYDFVAPHYSRYKYDASITNNICYPLIYGLFGENIRQPIGGDFAFSKEYADYLLNTRWTKNTPLFGIDIFMTTEAVLGGFKVCESNLGVKIHRAKDPGKSLSPMFRQVVSTIFKVIIDNKPKLKKMKKIKEIPMFGGKHLKEPEAFDVDMEGVKKRMVDGYREYKPMIKKCLPPEDFNKIKSCVMYNKIHVSDSWWAKIVYDYIVAFKKYEKKSSSVLKSLVPLWFGRIYTFMKETMEMKEEEAEEVILKQAEAFYEQRDYLLKKL
jgi:glycosyltransferase involved in cell wall biosynthesis